MHLAHMHLGIYNNFISPNSIGIYQEYIQPKSIWDLVVRRVTLMATAVSLLSAHRVPTPIRDMYEIQLHMGFGIDNEYVIEAS